MTRKKLEEYWAKVQADRKKDVQRRCPVITSTPIPAFKPQGYVFIDVPDYDKWWSESKAWADARRQGFSPRPNLYDKIQAAIEAERRSKRTWTR